MQKSSRNWTKLAILTGALLLPVTILVFGLLYAPLLINVSNVQWVLSRSGLADRISWQTLELSAENISLLEKRIQVSGTDLCFQKDSEELAICLGSVAIDVSLQLTFHGVEVKHVRRWRTTSGRLRLTPSTDATNPSPSSKIDPAQMVSDVRYWLNQSITGHLVDDFVVEFTEILIRMDESFHKGSARASGRTLGSVTTDEYNAEYAVNLLILESKSFTSGKFEAQLRSANNSEIFPLTIKGVGDLQIVNAQSVKFELFTDAPMTDRLVVPIQLAAIFQKGDSSAKLGFQGNITPSEATGNVTAVASARSGTDKFLDLNTNECSFRLQYSPMVLASECHAGLARSQLQKNGSRQALDLVELVAKCELKEKSSLLSETMYEASVKTDLQYEREGTAIAKGLLSLKSTNTVDQLLRGQMLNPKINFEAKVDRFRTLVDLLNDFGILVPAPFNALDGTIEFTVEQSERSSQPNPLAQSNGYPFHLRTTSDLRSTNQRVQWTGDFNMYYDEVKPALTVTGEMLIQQADFILPSISIARPPAMKLDSRIQSQAAMADAGPVPKKKTKVKQNAAFGFSYDITIRTTENGSVRLLNDITNSPISLALDLKLVSEEAPVGNIVLKPLDLTLFGRKAFVERAKLQLNPEIQQSEISSRIRMEFVDYKIYADLAGQVSQVQLNLSSTPPLVESDIYSVLLFGEPSSQLGEEERDSVAGTRAAMADKALGLFSLAVLASTPVERVGYDPQTQRISAKFKVGAKSSLLVGTNLGEGSSLLFKRRLGNAFEISTGLDREGNSTEDTSVSAFLDWFLRY